MLRISKCFFESILIYSNCFLLDKLVPLPYIKIVMYKILRILKVFSHVTRVSGVGRKRLRFVNIELYHTAFNF